MDGYSSSSQEDQHFYRRRHKGVAPLLTAEQQAKKKKPKLSPQEKINRTWRRFSSKRFNKVFSVLPFDSVPAPIASELPNELVRAGYDRAAEECRRKVQKIIHECRRLNMRYRDTTWDIDQDLCLSRGHCLNRLGKITWDVGPDSKRNPNMSVPKAVKRVHEVFERPTFMHKVSGYDVKQGALGDCWMIASLSGLANVPDAIQRTCVAHDQHIGIYGFVFYRDGEWVYSIVDSKLYLQSPNWDSPSMQRDLLQQMDRQDNEQVYRATYQTGSDALFFAHNADQNETWVPLLEKAFAKAHGDFASLHGGWVGEGFEDLSGGVTTELLASDILDVDTFWAAELSRVNDEFLFGCSTGVLERGYGSRDGIAEGHAYIVMAARTLRSGQRLVKLRNPWGRIREGLWTGAWSDGSKQWTAEAQAELGHMFGADSVFWIAYDDFLRKYTHFDRTRLFREPDWRCSQRWVAADVPWRPSWNEKFRVKVDRETPLVLVLSQLNDRYFRGLEGQYSFLLNFRLHERDRPEPEEYVVRSHGNYIMSRSVAVELPGVRPGEYSVFVSITATRNKARKSVEDVVKAQTHAREANDKLAAVGAAHDLAHSKAYAHMQAVKQARKRADHKKASDARADERVHRWEKHQMGRQIKRKQNRKNKEKATAKREKRQEDARARKEQAEKKEALEKVKTSKKEEDGSLLKREDEDEDEDENGEAEKEEEKVDDSSSQGGSPTYTPAGTPTAERDVGQDDDRSSEEGGGDSLARNARSDEGKLGTKQQPTTDRKLAGAPQIESNEVKKNIEDKETGEESDPKTAEQKADKSQPAGRPKDSSVSESSTTPAVLASGSSSKGGEKACAASPGHRKQEEPSPKSHAIAGCHHHCHCAEPAEAARQELEPACNLDLEWKRERLARAHAAAHAKQQMDAMTSGESSASPLSDWEMLYSSDDMTRRPGPAGLNFYLPRAHYREDTEDENETDPWNAVCVVGLRVYSKDERLRMWVVMEEGDGLEEGGMGEKGGADLDDGQANAGGARVAVGKREAEGGKKEGEEKKKGESDMKTETEDRVYEGDSEDGELKRASKTRSEERESDK